MSNVNVTEAVSWVNEATRNSQLSSAERVVLIDAAIERFYDAIDKLEARKSEYRKEALRDIQSKPVKAQL